MARDFEVIGRLEHPEAIARGVGIRERHSLAKRHGKGDWRKVKATALVLLANGDIRYAEVHWYEAHGIGRVRWKIKAFLD